MENNDIDIIKPPRPRRMGAPLAHVTVLESSKAYGNLQSRFAEECLAKNVQEESDLLALAQLRWNFERLDGVKNEAMNWHIRRGRPDSPAPETLTNAERLSLTVLACSTDGAFLEVLKQYTTTIKTMHALAGRVERRK
jgi:hypothetical protein